MSEPSSSDHPSLSLDRALDLLTRGVIQSQSLLPWGSNYTFLIRVALDDLQTAAIYKPRDGERPLWDFPDGTLCQREVAAFVVSQALDWSIVPPTVLRDGPNGVGMVIWEFAGQPLSDRYVKDLRGFRVRLDRSNDPATRSLAQLLDRREINALKRRAEQLMQSGCYPRPMPGYRQIPWPPV